MMHIIDSLSFSVRQLTETSSSYPGSLIPLKPGPSLIKLAVCCFLFSMPPVLSAAQPQSSVLMNRLCKSWRMEKLVQGDKEVIADNAVGDFMLIIHPDHTVQQGMYPDGLIKATWSVDEPNMVISIKDNETNIVYPMKIISVTRNELVLRDQAAANGVTIYYKTK